jgi:hypothetical protein
VAEKKEDSTGAANSTKQGEPEVLDAERARKALLDMIDAGGLRAGKAELLAIIRRRLQAAKVEEGDGDWVLLDNWQCNLKKRIFLLTIGGSGFLNTYSGNFAWSIDVWRASVKEKRYPVLPK